MGGDVAADIGKGIPLVRGHNDLIEMEFEKEKSGTKPGIFKSRELEVGKLQIALTKCCHIMVASFYRSMPRVKHNAVPWLRESM